MTGLLLIFDLLDDTVQQVKPLTLREFYHNARLVDGLAEGKQLVVTANGKPKFVVSKGSRPKMVRVGYRPHVEFDWTDAVRTAAELRAEYSLKRVVRAMDLFHIAIAIEVGADALLSSDTDPIALAGAAGLAIVNLAQRSP